MDGLTVVLGVLAIAGIGGVVWLALGRAKLSALAAGERAGRAAAEAMAGEARAEISRQETAGAELRGTLMRVSADRSALEQQLAGEREAHRTTRETLEREGVAEREALEERLTAEVAHVEAVAREKMEAVEREKRSIEKKLEQFDKQLREAFASLSSEALAKNREQFLALAEQKLEAKRGAVDDLVRPIAETLKRTGEKLAVIEQAGNELRGETGKLVRALREPQVRGRYGEIQLRRVAELAGMVAYCDFTEQEQTRGIDGAPLRPDMVVKLPSGRSIVVDAKTNIQGYLDAMSAATPELAEECLERFAKLVGDTAMALARKKYWTQYDGSPEFVVMFVPGDQFVDAALRRQPDLIERAAEQGVILASPATLIGLLRAVAVGYQEVRLGHAAEDLRELGKELHERAATAIEHVVKLGQALGQTVERYNDFVGSYERRLEPVLRKFEDNGVKSGKELPETPVVEVRPRELMGQLRLMDE